MRDRDKLKYRISLELVSVPAVFSGIKSHSTEEAVRSLVIFATRGTFSTPVSAILPLGNLTNRTALSRDMTSGTISAQTFLYL